MASIATRNGSCADDSRNRNASFGSERSRGFVTGPMSTSVLSSGRCEASSETTCVPIE